MLRKFFFDDVRTAPDTDWTVAKDVPQAREILSREQFDVWSLDHDIGYQLICDECYVEWVASVTPISEWLLTKDCKHRETGTTLANWALENIKVWPELIVIHSGNPYRAAVMKDLLKDKSEVLIVPFDPVALRSIRRK